MKLWIVSRRAPLRRGERKVWVTRWVSMAPTKEAAIARVQAIEAPDDIPEMASNLRGVWSAQERDIGVADLGAFSTEATAVEQSERKARDRKGAR